MKFHFIAKCAALWSGRLNARAGASIACCLVLAAYAVSGCGKSEREPDGLEAALPAGREIFSGIVENWNNNDTATLVELVNGKSILEDPAGAAAELRTLRDEVGPIRHHADFKLIHNNGKSGQTGDFVGASSMVAERGAVVLRLGLDRTHAVVHFSMTGRQFKSRNPSGSDSAVEPD